MFNLQTEQSYDFYHTFGGSQHLAHVAESSARTFQPKSLNTLSEYIIYHYILKVNDVMYCPNCGKGNPEGARFCMHCGLELNEYKVEISPKIEISPNIIVQMMDKGRINSLVTGKANKILENTISLKCIQKEKAKFSPEEILALNSVMQIAKELEEELDEKGKVDLSIMYSHQNLESFVEFLDGIPDDCYEEVNTYEALINLKGAILRVLNRYDEAIHCFDKVLEKNPKSVFALVEKGRTIWWSSAGPFTEHCDKLFKGLCTKGEIEDLRQKRDLINKEARKCFDKALRLSLE